MSTPRSVDQAGASKGAALMSLTGIALCGLCCATPLLAALGLGGAALSAAAGMLELAGMVLLVVGLGWLGVAGGRRMRSTSCGTQCSVECSCRNGA